MAEGWTRGENLVRITEHTADLHEYKHSCTPLYTSEDESHEETVLSEV